MFLCVLAHAADPAFLLANQQLNLFVHTHELGWRFSLAKQLKLFGHLVDQVPQR